MNPRTRIFLTMLATLIGGLSLVLYTTITESILFDTLSFCTSSTSDLVLGSTALIASAMVAGFIATLIVVKDNFVPHIFISMFLVGKLCFVALCGHWHGPLWFETGLHLSLIGGLWLGRYGAVKFPLAPV
ncbi:hypothetical protein KIM67_11360 [Flagellimonas sp. 389]|uniref:hypothetical protein n=1 Tax=Flagellimonas sp. 389 TaxID=2835862 RepID=UPI001BD6A203|nr:hypothetical protein [Flagellimonas sp. 389]MBS9463011.1 hypothetical protein [Flagellimonas sp. 389]